MRGLSVAALLLALGIPSVGGPRGTAEDRALAREGPEHERPTVYASFYPLAFFAEYLAGDALRVVCPVPPGEDPATWLPDRETVAELQAAPLLLVHGASFEHWLGLVSLPLWTTVVGTRGLRDRLMEYGQGAQHSHGPGGPPAHRGLDAHTWLDPLLALEEARVVQRALERLCPERRAALEARFGELHVALTRLADELRALGPMLEGPEGRILVASHPAYEYLARGYGWRVENVLLDPEADADPTADAAVRARLSALVADGARLVLWETPPAEPARRALEALGLRSVVFSPCETLAAADRAAGRDFLALMGANVERLRQALEGTR